MGSCITVQEHQTVGVTESPTANSLSLEESEAAARITEQRKGFCERGYGNVRFAQYCGLVSLGERALEVLPKVGESAEEPGKSRTRLLRVNAVRLLP